MSILKILFLGPLSILCLEMSAQVDDLLKNKNITWIAESYNDFLTEQATEDKVGKQISRVTQLKYLNIKEDAVEETSVFQNILMNAVKEGKVTLYPDDNCRQSPFPPSILMRVDTIVQINPTTYEQIYRVIYNYPQPEDIVFFRAHQIIFYDAQKAQFGIRTIAIAPMIREMTVTGEFLMWKPLFWIKPTDLTKPNKLTNDDITWATRMSSGSIQFAADYEETFPIKVLKTAATTMPMGHLFNVLEQDMKVPFYHIEQANPKVKLTATERQKLFITTDTIMTIDPITYETKTRIVSNKLEGTDIKHLRLIQNWYWNDKLKRLEIYFVATAPLKNVRNEAGEFLFRMPVFYRRTND